MQTTKHVLSQNLSTMKWQPSNTSTNLLKQRQSHIYNMSNQTCVILKRLSVYNLSKLCYSITTKSMLIAYKNVGENSTLVPIIFNLLLIWSIPTNHSFSCTFLATKHKNTNQICLSPTLVNTNMNLATKTNLDLDQKWM